jgi:hypothetical protein
MKKKMSNRAKATGNLFMGMVVIGFSVADLVMAPSYKKVYKCLLRVGGIIGLATSALWIEDGVKYTVKAGTEELAKATVALAVEEALKKKKESEEA